jgi:hypothetical protein
MVDNAKLGSSPSSQMVAFVIVIVWMEQPSSECQRPNSLSAVIILRKPSNELMKCKKNEQGKGTHESECSIHYLELLDR